MKDRQNPATKGTVPSFPGLAVQLYSGINEWAQ